MRRAKKTNSRFVFVGLFLISFFFLFGLLIYFKVSNLDKFIFISRSDDDGGDIYVIESNPEKIIRYKIKNDTLLTSSRGYGEYKLGSLWVLGEKEGIDGELVVETVRSNYLLPIYLWKNGNTSNLNLYQKIKVKFILNKNINIDKTFETTSLTNAVYINFVNEYIQESGVSVEVFDFTSDAQTIDKVSKIVGVLGTKVSGYTKGYDENLDCEIAGKNSQIVEFFSNVFDCKIVDNQDISESKIKLRLGAKFSQRF